VFIRVTNTYSGVRNFLAVQRAYLLCVSSRHHKGAPRIELKRSRLSVEWKNVKILKFVSIAVRVAIFRLRPNLHRVLSLFSVYTCHLHVLGVRNVLAVQRAYLLCVSSRHHKGAPRIELKRSRLLVVSRNIQILKFVSIAVRVAIFRLRPHYTVFHLILVFIHVTYTYSGVRNIIVVQRAYLLCVTFKRPRVHKRTPRVELKRSRNFHGAW